MQKLYGKRIFKKAVDGPVQLTFAIAVVLSAVSCGEAVPERGDGRDTAGIHAVVTPDDLYRQGISFSESRAHARAIACFNRAIALRPGFSEAHLRLGLLKLSEKRYSGARGDLGKAITLLYADTGRRMRQGFAGLRGGYYAGMADNLRKADAGGACLAEAYRGRAVCSLHLDEKAAALRDMNMAVGFSQKDAASYYIRGLCLYMAGREKDAFRNLQRAIELKRDCFEAYYIRAAMFASLGRMDEAIRDLTSALALDSEYSMAYYNRGVLHGKSGRFQREIEDYTRALKFDAHFIDALYNRGLAFYRKGMFRKALKDFGEAVKSSPRDADAVFNRAMAHACMGNGEDTLLDITKAMKINPLKSDFYNRREEPCPGRDIQFDLVNLL